ncbi:glycoside hydrolase family 78 protein [Streptomyces atroolivaceus]|uniref:alpha-L-rhamnosidase n=1 Tax=Streptomyces atroolivaceus TaxID=66869 RepID=A0ABV9VK14_STRAZ|nr:glycoside hydrolase family 78 protein [Streptomyces atroolivaceus]
MTLWHGRFIAADSTTHDAPLLRHTFTSEQSHGPIQQATLALSALGVCEAFVNGVAVSDDLLTPGWSSYEWRVRYTEHDVTPLLAPRSTIGIALGNGWYRGRLGWGGGAEKYGDEIAAFAQLRIRYADGHEQVVATDSTWRSGAGPVTANDLYDGQSIDARRADGAWMLPGFDDSGWQGVHVVDADLGILEPYIGPPVRRQEEIAPVDVFTSPSGATLVDFGVNIVGWVRAQVTGAAGSVVTLRHAEVLEAGEIGVRPLRTAKATDTFTLSGGEDVFEPTFTFHGFRYVEVTGWPEGATSIADGGLTAVVIGSALRRTGTFSCSDPLLNQLHTNVVRGLRGNFVDVPTDCPQRDERLGWTGDISVFTPTASYLFDVKDFLRDWLRDLHLEQANRNGLVPVVVPDVMKKMQLPPGVPEVDSTAIWGDAAAWVPWALWQAYGDPVVLEESFDAMAAHVRRVRSLLSPTGVWDAGFQFADWLDPDSDPAQPWMSKADNGVVATASAYRSAVITSDTAAVLGRTADREEFREMAAGLRRAFREQYVDGERILSDCTTVYSLAIVFGLLDDDEATWAGARLAELVAESDYVISTGFAGTPFVTDALSRTGHTSTAYRLLLQKECPSWLYPVTMGATTIWERWDSMLPDGSINPGEMTSFNHYALGSVADWMHRVVAGIAPLDPGYRRILIAPQPGGGLDWAESELDTPHGVARVHWSSTAGTIELDLTVPSGSTAVVRLPGRPEHCVGPGNHTLTAEAGDVTGRPSSWQREREVPEATP